MTNDKRKVTKASNPADPALVLALLLLAPMLAAAATLTGTIKDPAGTGITGTVELKLSAPGRVADPALLLIQPTVKCALSAGALGSCAVRGNDAITEPAGTFYCVRVLASDGRELMPGRKYTVTGASFDLGAVQPGEACK